ncbi:protein kinase domain-containing protein [Streptomyces hokutonensis]|uniref:serine/threonine-protein kinase n=1 Tax=Streptomyces hokutonensis TaxID=1306990 RepID=UPI0005BC7C2A|nr:serine/threonine-protein kinase [Streptomyces hokutonensis]
MALHRGDAESIGGYVLGDRLGSGGMGVVYLGRSASGRQVAVKVVHAQYAQDEEFRARFRQEIAAVRRVSGAFTAPVVDADPDAEVPWMATLYVPGRTLAEVVEKDGPLGGRTLRTLALGLVEALRDIHQAGVVHRDLKPSNVLLAEDGPRVIDFGISRAADNQTLTVTGRLIGTPPFMSPEQFAAPRDVTAASDIFSLGSLLVYAATGNRPFDGASPYLTGYQVMHEQPRLDGVPEPLRSIAERCLDKEATARPRLADLHGMLLTLPESATVVSPPGGERPRPGTSVTVPESGPRRRRTRRLVIAVATALAVTGLGLTTLHWVSSGTTGTTAPAAATRSASAVTLPAGWRPWRASLLTAKTGEPLDELESGCVTGAGTLVYCAGTGFTVTALDAASGRVAWRSGTSPETSRPVGVEDGRVFTYVKPDSTQTFVTRRLVALDARTGSQLWAHPVSEDRNAVMFDGGILAMDENATKFVAYDPTGHELWTAPAKSSAGDACTPAVLDGTPYGLCTPADDPSKGGVALLHLNPADGTSKEIAQLPTGAEPLGVSGERLVFAVPKLAEGSFGSGEDQPYTALEEVDPADGGERIPLPGAARGTPTLLKGVIHFVRPNGTVTAVRASDGKQLWQRATEIENLSAPVLSAKSNTLYFANRFGRLLAVNARTGTVRWRTSALQNPGDSTDDTVPYTLLVKDALVAVAGDTAFSVRTDRPVLPR